MASRDPATASADHTAAASRLGRAVIVAVFAAVLLHWLVGPIAGVAVWSWPVLQRQRASARRQEQILGELPEVIDLFRLAAASGLNVRLSVAAVARRAPEVVGASLARAVDQLVLGGRLSSLLTQMAVEIGEPIRPLVAALLDSERYGTPLSDALDRLAIEARLQRRHRAEEVARRLPVKLLFPLVLLVLPAFVVLTLVPLLAGSLRGLRW